MKVEVFESINEIYISREYNMVTNKNKDRKWICTLKFLFNNIQKNTIFAIIF